MELSEETIERPGALRTEDESYEDPVSVYGAEGLTTARGGDESD